jgi:hypothetical protein
MAEIIVKIPDDLRREIDRAPSVDWSKVARDAIRERSARLTLLKSIASKSKLTEKEALELGRKVSKGLHERYKKMNPELK